MKNKRILALLALTISASVFMSACSFFGGDEPEESVAVTVTPTPVATETPTPEPTIAPNVQSTTYTSADKTMAINLPDATWSNKSDETDMLSFESPEQGSILVLHGQGADTMSSTVIPTTEDMAVSLEQADGDKTQGTDFNIYEYKSEDVNGIGVYSYVTKMLNTEKSGGSRYVIHKVFANDTEYYNITASVKTKAALDSVRAAVDSFQILGDSSLKEAAPATAAATTPAGTDTASTDSTAGTDTPSTDGTSTDGTTTDGTASDGTSTDSSTADASQSDSNDSSSGSSDDSSDGYAGFTNEQLSNTDETRTIYRNSDGHPIVVTPDGNGNWGDFDGNTYRFTGESDVYDQNDESYYWHGEAADVYYMTVR